MFKNMFMLTTDLHEMLQRFIMKGQMQENRKESPNIAEPWNEHFYLQGHFYLQPDIIICQVKYNNHIQTDFQV